MHRPRSMLASALVVRRMGSNAEVRHATKIRRVKPSMLAMVSRNVDCRYTVRGYSSNHPRLWNGGCMHASRCALGSTLFLTSTPSGPSPWLVLGTFVGIPMALWAYKCLMMVLFQRKIIYMGYVPPDARTQNLSDPLVKYSPAISCDEVIISADKNVTLRGIFVKKLSTDEPHTVIVYLQGNAGNPLGRIPVLERLLLESKFGPQQSSNLDSSAILAVAPRSYWKSSRRTPTEKGIIADYTHVLAYASRRFPKAKIVLYGHSLGGAAAVCLSASLNAVDFPTVQGMILENAFQSIPSMVQALYPQRWLPYHYLGRFAFDKWDTLHALRTAPSDSLLERLAGRMLMILSEKDEVVPTEMGEAIFRATEARVRQSSQPEGHRGRLKVIRGALHETAWMDRRWKTAIGDYLDWLHCRPEASAAKA